jgi:hypothetical protein
MRRWDWFGEWCAGRGILVLALAATGAACGRAAAPAPVAPPAGYSMSGDGGAVQADGAATPARCSVEMECPAPAGECMRAVCLPDGVCGRTPQPAGARAIWQRQGDCVVNACDGAGGVTAAPDDSDVPDDGNGCTEDSCAGGVPVFSNRPMGASCAEGAGAICDGNGQCVAAEPSPRVL